MKRPIPASLAWAVYQWTARNTGGYALSSCCGTHRGHPAPMWGTGSEREAPANYIGVSPTKLNSLDEAGPSDRAYGDIKNVLDRGNHFIIKDKETDYGNMLLSWVDKEAIEAYWSKIKGVTA